MLTSHIYCNANSNDMITLCLQFLVKTTIAVESHIDESPRSIVSHSVIIFATASALITSYHQYETKIAPHGKTRSEDLFHTLAAGFFCA